MGLHHAPGRTAGTPPGPDSIDALAATADVTADDDKAGLLARLAEYLPGSLQREAVSLAGAIEDEEERTWALAN